MLVLKQERLRRGWSQTRVSMLTGIAPSDISNIERGNRPAFPTWRARIADAFGLPEALLFARAEERSGGTDGPLCGQWGNRNEAAPGATPSCSGLIAP